LANSEREIADNRKFCKKLGIRLSEPAIGRPPKQIYSQLKIQARQDELDRIPIEDKFCQAKRRLCLPKIMSKLARTSETAIAVTFIVLNIEGARYLTSRYDGFI
jgi:IS5 family transposase